MMLCRRLPVGTCAPLGGIVLCPPLRQSRFVLQFAFRFAFLTGAKVAHPSSHVKL